ncbi:MAG: peptidoglycan DD-metalloendopeptidase family protein [Muribaculaceae bacterium]|nr:peptidoglycan DD-metalloendopeptidase family protein [Muribaculaceae bacterium]
MKKSIILLLAIFFTISSVASPKKSRQARSSEKIRQEQRDTRKRISNTKNEINENTRKTRDGLKRLGEIEADIAVRQEAINRTGARISELNARIARLADSIATIENNITTLKNDYAGSLRAIRRQRQTLNTISYIFSAESFAQAFRRIRYMQELGHWRKAKTIRLGEAVSELNLRKIEIDSVRQRVADEQAALIAAKSQLDNRRAEASVLVDDLKKQGRSLSSELRRQQQQLTELNRELDRAIAEEVRRAEEERKRKAAEEEKRRRADEERRKKAEQAQQNNDNRQETPKESTKSDKPAPPTRPAGESGFAEQERRLTGDFEANKGRLLFPVAGKYTITGAYGRHTRPGTNVAIDNHGIDISVDQGTNARAVFNGEVVSVFKVKGTGFYAVLVRHGRYISVYSKLASYNVRNGQQIKAGQSIGTVFTDPELGATVLHFELRRESATLNPLEWVK